MNSNHDTTLPKVVFLILVFLIPLAPRAPAIAHPISLTEARVLVQREKITVKLSVFVEDLFLFQGIEPNKDNFLPPKAILEGRTKHQAFLLERFTIRDVEGILLSGKVVKIKDFEMPEQGIGMGELMDFSYTYDIEYPLEAPADYLTFSQRMVDETAGLPAETRMEVLQAGSDTPIYVTLFPETPETLPFDWSRPPLTSDASEAEWDSWYERRIEQELGITNYSSVYSFLYIEDYEVRHEILIPLLTLQSSVYIPRRDEAFLDLDEQEEARRQVGAFFAAGNPIVIDGVTVQPKVDRIDFYGVALKDFAQQAPAKRVSMANARAGIILSYSCKNTPNNVALHWDQFNDDIWRIGSTVYAFDEVKKHVFRRGMEENVYRWTNPGRPPLPPVENVRQLLPQREVISVYWYTLVALVIALVTGIALRMSSASRQMRISAFVIGLAVIAFSFRGPSMAFDDPLAKPPIVAEGDARDIVEILQQNIYRAFDYKDEDQVYDALAKSVHGPLLEEIYLKVQNGLKMEEQGGAVSRVRRVELVEGTIEGPFDWETGFQFRCAWNVEGTVEHWGHIHTRTSQYRAVLRIQADQNAWRIIELDVLDEERGILKTNLRRL
ncbi:MAG TPA: hypothetical protein EYQ75_15585 [Planctomycetaceae bacterium]|nr:hypothetical protein [Planctomycetaceae bacterium]